MHLKVLTTSSCALYVFNYQSTLDRAPSRYFLENLELIKPKQYLLRQDSLNILTYMRKMRHYQLRRITKRSKLSGKALFCILFSTGSLLGVIPK